MVQGVKELEEDFHHVFFNVEVDQVDKSTMSFTEGGAFGNPGCELLELGRDSHKMDLDSFPAWNFHDLQNKNKAEDPKPLKWLVNAYDVL